jgi:uncharacterized protein
MSNNTAILPEKEAVRFLEEYTGKNFKIILNHSRLVKKISVRIANQIKNKGHKVDIHFIKSASLLHDIGRNRCPPSSRINSHFHGIAGAEILRMYRLERYARVCERHLGAGIGRKEAKKLKFPKRVYVPTTIEEKIICYADKLASGNKTIKIESSIERFNNEIGKEAGSRIKKLHNYLVSMGMKSKKL